MRKFIPLLAILALLTGSFPLQPVESAAGWQTKVDPWVLQTAESGETEFLIFLSEQADLSGAQSLAKKAEKGAYVYRTLTETAARTQDPLLAELDELGLEHQSFWVANMIWARGNLAAVQTLAQRSDVAHLYANPTVKLSLPQAITPAANNPEAIEWNVLKVNADDLWALGYDGQGVVIGGQDTGYDWDHPALKTHYRGWDGTTANHNYNWHDAIDPPSATPIDPYGHGTHTMGTMVGDDGAGNQVGIAPGAQWIGCRNMDAGGNGTPASYSECYQWFIAPTPVVGGLGDPTKAPDVINNSWGCPVSEGCTDPNVLLTVTENVRAAGIATVHSAGNDGSSCSSLNTPSAIYAASFSVAATDSGDNIASFSSRGPVTVDGSNRLKPEISAPGVSIRSSTPGTGYGSSSGTSMAGPHIAGVAALLISANPGLAGNVDEIETLMETTAVPRTTTQVCGGVPGSAIPNNTYGYGRVDALAAYQAMHSLSVAKTASATIVQPGEVFTYTISLTHQHASLPTFNVQLSDQLPAGTVFVTATLPHSFDGSTVEWQKPQMAAGETWQVTLTAQAALTVTGSIVNENYTADSDEALPVTGAPVEVGVAVPTLGLVKAAPSTVAPGGVITYSLTVENPDDSVDQHNLVLSDTLPANTQFIAASDPFTQTGGVVQWNRAALAAGDEWQVTLAVRVPLTFTGTISNEEYGVRSDEFGPLAGPPVHSEIFALAVGKQAHAASVAPGGWITYTIAVTNLHPSAAVSGVVLSDTLPAATTFVAASGNYTLTAGVAIWEWAALGAGETATATLTVQVGFDAGLWVTNDQYAASCEQTGGPVWGSAVATAVSWLRIFLPLVIR